MQGVRIGTGSFRNKPPFRARLIGFIQAKLSSKAVCTGFGLALMLCMFLIMPRSPNAPVSESLQNAITEFIPTTAQDIFLLLVFSVDFEPPALLKHFIDHYLFLGIPRENFLLIFHSEKDDNPKLEPLVKVLDVFGMKHKKLWVGTFLPPMKLQLERELVEKFVGNTSRRVDCNYRL